MTKKNGQKGTKTMRHIILVMSQLIITNLLFSAAAPITCCICYEEKPQSDGFHCYDHGTDGDDFICHTCLEGHARTFPKRTLINCPACSTELSPSFYKDHLQKSIVLQLQKNKDEQFLLQDQKTAELSQAKTGQEETIEEHIKIIKKRILTKACPRCDLAFSGWTGCAALTCVNCEAGFCGICLTDCGKDAHTHLEEGDCDIFQKAGLSHSLYPDGESLAKLNTTRIQEALKQYFQSKNVSDLMRQEILKRLRLHPFPK